MGGASSNAATFIHFLKENKLLNLTEQEWLKIALNIGADVPFFLNGTTALVEGIGDKVYLKMIKSIFLY